MFHTRAAQEKHKANMYCIADAFDKHCRREVMIF
jgi:hypothetical protein